MATKQPTEQALDVLARCTVDGFNVKLPDEQLERNLYTEVKKYLEGIGGKWKGGKTQAFVFEHDPTELLQRQADGEGVNLKKEYQFFETPEELAERMASLIQHCRPGMKVLEPSAGKGRLIKAIQAHHGKDIVVDAFELMDINRNYLQTLPYVNVLGEDFLAADIEGVYDVIIANPPFTKGQDLVHIEKMYKALKPNGRLVTVCSPSYTFGEQKKHVSFRSWLKEKDAFQEELPQGTFSESGTEVRSMLIVLDKLEVVQNVTLPPAPPKKRKRTADMHAIIMNNDALLTALKKCREVIDKKPALASIANVLLRVNNDSMQLICTDLEVTLITTLTCENEDKAKFEVLLPFDLFFDVVRLNHHNLLEMETDTVKASFKGLNDKFEVNALEEVAEFPTIPEFPDSAEYKINSDFIHSINAALTTVSKDTLRPSMTKVCVEFRDGYMHVVSTNANVLFRKSTEVGILGHTELLIGEKVARALNGFTETMITWNENHVAFKCGDLTVIATRQAEKYPDYRSVIPLHIPNIVLNRIEFISALERVLITTDDTKQARFYLKSHIGQIRLEAVDNNKSRRTYVDLPADYTGSCESIAFNAAYMIALLKQVQYEDIHLAIESPGSAVLLTNPSDEGYLGLIMPIVTGV